MATTDARAALAELRARHSPESKPDACLAVHGGPHPICDYCVSTWPCDGARLLDVAEAAMALSETFPEIEVCASPFREGLTYLAPAGSMVMSDHVLALRAALARLGEGEGS